MRLFTFTFSLVFAALVAPVASQEYQEMRWKGTNKCLTSPPNPKNLDRVYLWVLGLLAEARECSHD